jgi:hypothetical protein
MNPLPSSSLPGLTTVQPGGNRYTVYQGLFEFIWIGSRENYSFEKGKK